MGGQLIGPASRALLPDALLLHARRLEERVGILTDGEGRIAALLPEAELPAARWERFPGEIWTAAPVLAHAHLDGWDAPVERLRRAPFAAWIEDLLEWRGAPGRMSPAASAGAALGELQARGCGLVAVHAGEPGVLPPPPSAVEVLAWREVLDPFPAQGAEAAADAWRTAAVDCAGLALHAPYTVDLGLARCLFARGQQPFSLHLGESPEEREFLRSGSGPLADLLRTRRGRAPTERFASPVAWLAAAGGLGPATLAVHCGDLDVAELRALASAGTTIAFCPGTQDWFGRSRPAFAAAGVYPDALGCDSRASNVALDPLREFRLACAQFPERSRSAWWTALTEGGAEALRRPELGRLVPGCSARALRLRDDRAWAQEEGPAARAAAVCAWLAETADPGVRGVTMAEPSHA